MKFHTTAQEIEDVSFALLIFVRNSSQLLRLIVLLKNQKAVRVSGFLKLRITLEKLQDFRPLWKATNFRFGLKRQKKTNQSLWLMMIRKKTRVATICTLILKSMIMTLAINYKDLNLCCDLESCKINYIYLLFKMEKGAKITVLGSGNYDTFISVERAPEKGETISASSLKNSSGGKGANQAAAIGSLGYSVDFVCQVANDSSGETLMKELKEHNVDMKYCKVLEGSSTGQAFILSYPDHDNSIVIVGGANMDWKGNDLEGLKKSLSDCKILLDFKLNSYCSKEKSQKKLI